jgi:RNA polymerase sigma-70 factor (ECF subfamily)
MNSSIDIATRISVLLDAANPDNRKAREAFMECYGGVIREWCRRNKLQKADEEDVVQTVVPRLLKKLQTFKYDPSKRFRGYVHQCVVFAINDIYRKRKRHPGVYGSGDTGVVGQLHEIPDPDTPAVEELTQELSRQAERDRRVQEACDRVRRRCAPKTWQAFWLTTVEELPAVEVAEQLGMTHGAVRVAKHKMITALKNEMRDMAE